MTGAEIITMAEGLVDDSFGDTLGYQLLNVAKNLIEEERPWEMLKKLDETKSRAVGDTIATTKTLPTDFRLPFKLFVGDEAGEYFLIPFEEKHRQQSAARKYLLDMANGVIRFTGTCTLAGTIHNYYIRTTDDVAAGTSPVWPSRFHPLIAFKMAELFYPVDAGEKARAWDDRWNTVHTNLRSLMVGWDNALKLAALNNAGRELDENFTPDIT